MRQPRLGRILAFMLVILGAIAPAARANIFETEPNDSPFDFGVIPFTPGGQPLQGDFDGFSYSDDYWEFTTVVGRSYTFTVTTTACVVSGNNNPDLGLAIVNSAGTPLVIRDNGGLCASESLTWVATSSSTYYLVVFEATLTPTGGIADYVVANSQASNSPTPSLTPSPSPTPSATPTPQIVSTRSVPIEANNVLYDAGRGWLYATVGSPAGFLGQGNSVHLIDPVNGKEGPAVWVGSEPGQMAMSSDGQYLYVALQGAAAARRVNLDTLQLEQQFTFGNEPFDGARYPTDIACLPGSPSSFVQTGHSLVSTATYGARVYDDGVPRAAKGDNYAVVIEADDTGAFLFAYNSESSGFQFYRYAVGPTGLTLSGSSSSLISGFNTDMRHAAGRIYTTTGRVIDPIALTLIGTFTAGGPVAPDPASNRIFSLSSQTLNIIDLTTRATLKSVNLGAAGGGALNMVRWGNTGLAIPSSDGNIYLINVVDPALMPQTPDFPPAPAPPVAFPDSPPQLAISYFQPINLQANHIVWDKTRGRLHASVLSTDPNHPDTITQIDPGAAIIGPSRAMGSEPNLLALSAGDEKLYTSLDTPKAVAELNLSTFTENFRYFITPHFASDLAVSPDDPTAVAIAKRTSSFFDRVTMYKAGIMLPDEHFSFYYSSRIEFGATGGVMYGLEPSYGDSSRFLVNASGFATTGTLGVFDLFGGSDIEFSAGRLYTNGGRVFDPETPLELKGTYYNFGTTYAYFQTVEPDPTKGWTYFLDWDFFSDKVRVVVFDQATYLAVGAVELPGTFMGPHDLVRYGQVGIAFIDDDLIYVAEFAELMGAQNWERYD